MFNNISFSLQGAVLSFLLACLIFFLLDKVADLFVKDPRANEVFKGILLIVCVVIAIIGAFIVG